MPTGGGPPCNIFKTLKNTSESVHLHAFSTMPFPVVVYAYLGKFVVPSGTTCAERRMIRKIKLEASRRGVAGHAMVAWARRKFGFMSIERPRADGSPGVSLPCICCTQALQKFTLRWVAHSDYNGNTITDADERPTPPKPTRGLQASLRWRNAPNIRETQ